MPDDERQGDACSRCGGLHIVRTKGRAYCMDCGAEWHLGDAPSRHRKPGGEFAWGTNKEE